MLSSHSIPTIVAKMVLEQLQKKLAFSKLFNSDYVGEVSYGSSVKIVSIGTINVTPYTRYNPLTWQQVEDDSVTLPIDEGESVSFAIDDLDAAQARPSILAPYIRQSAIDLRDTIDQYLALTISEQTDPIIDELGTDESPLDINSANIGSTLIRMARLLDDAKVPREKRAAILPGWTFEDLVLASITEITDNKQIAANGWVGRYSGFDLYLSHNITSGDTVDEGGSGTADRIVAGSPISGTMAVQVEKEEILRLQAYFADGFRALVAFGAKITRPDTICVATCDEAAEA